MEDKLDRIIKLLESQNEMIKDIHDYVRSSRVRSLLDRPGSQILYQLGGVHSYEGCKSEDEKDEIDLLKKQGWRID